jgi:hypothetical protein
MITFQAHLASRPTFLARLNYGDNTKKPAIPAMKKAQINLCRQLGLIDDERKPIKQVLINYSTMYRGPLPPQVIDALSTFFGILDELTTQLDEVMMQLACVGIDDINAGGFADDVV